MEISYKTGGMPSWGPHSSDNTQRYNSQSAVFSTKFEATSNQGTVVLKKFHRPKKCNYNLLLEILKIHSTWSLVKLFVVWLDLKFKAAVVLWHFLRTLDSCKSLQEMAYAHVLLFPLSCLKWHQTVFKLTTSHPFWKDNIKMKFIIATLFASFSFWAASAAPFDEDEWGVSFINTTW